MSERLSVGDGIAVVALLAFTIGWVSLWVFGPSSSFDFGGAEVDGSTAAVVLLVLLTLIVGPPLWAARMVRAIVAGPSASGESAP